MALVNLLGINTKAKLDTATGSGWGAGILQWIQPMALSIGQTFYASPSGSDNNPGTIGSPWRSVSKANSLSAGQKLILRAGSYGGIGTTFTWTAVGTQANPITIEGYPGETPIIEGEIIIRGPWQRWSRSYFRGPTGDVGGPGYLGNANFVNLDGPHLELSYCEVAYSQWHAGISGSDASDYRILSCYVHDNGGPEGDYTDPSQDNTSHGGYLSPSSYGLVANCLIEHNDAKGINARHATDHLIMTHNTIVANGRHGIDAAEQANNWISANNILINNGSVKNGEGISTNNATGPFTNINNIFHNNGTSGNGTYDTTQNTTNISPLVQNPLLVNPATYTDHQDPAPNWNHRLQSNSPAIGYGASDYGMPYDILGNPRNSRFDCGAYQYV